MHASKETISFISATLDTTQNGGGLKVSDNWLPVLKAREQHR